MVSRSSSDEGSSTVSPAPSGLRDYSLEGVAGAPELAAGELVVDEHRNSGCPGSQRAFCPEGLVEENLVPRCL